MSYSASFIEYCATHQLKLTSLRKEVLYILWSAEKPLKAYEILDGLLKLNSSSTPTSVYRALVFFVAAGIVHKIESIQSYTLCCEPQKHLSSEVLMVCNDCHAVIEVYDPMLRELVLNLSTQHFFDLKQDAIELKGLCKMCS